MITALLIKAYVRFHPRRTRFEGFDVYTPGGCLPPRFTVSTGLLAGVLRGLAGPGVRVLDVGCGSGALSLVAAGVGSYVVGTELDPVCAAAARRNAEANGLGGLVDVVVCWGARCLRRGFDLAVCNPPFLPVEGGAAYGCGRGCRVAAEMLGEAAGRAGRLLYAWSSLSGPPPLGCRVVASRRGLLDRVYVCLHDGLPGARGDCWAEA